jgi:H+/Cl- antiporter ClcA
MARFAPVMAGLREPVRPGAPGDFTTSLRVVPIALVGVLIGLAGAVLAWTLLKLIALFTNIFWFQRFSTRSVNISDAHIGIWMLVVPVVGGLIIGLMARYGSERIRGHGIPEAIEAILINGSRVQPRVSILKPLSSAVSIGSGGPFGAEGPIIMTGGAVGSMASQLLHLSAAERKTLLVAGAAAGMSATFSAPVAAVLLAVELLLFEWKPRSLIPVAIASATAAMARHWMLPSGPLFPVPTHPDYIGLKGMLACLVVGVSAGALSAGLTAAVYGCEDAFHRLPIHWMWWPAIGGLAIGIGGLIFPEALGVGYGTIGVLLTGTASTRVILGVIFVKSSIWAISLGSGTSGGVLAPLLMMGAAMGALEAHFLPGAGAGFWPLIGMGAILGGTMRSPLTGVIFVLELTHDTTVLLPLLAAVMVAHGFTVLTLRRSILTEKLSRRGHHLAREYAVDVLDGTLVRNGMRTDLVAIPAEATTADLAEMNLLHYYELQEGYPIVAAENRVCGMISGSDLRSLIANYREGGGTGGFGRFGELSHAPIVSIGPDATMRDAAESMARCGRTAIPVLVDGRLVGLVSVRELLAARIQAFDEERQRERVLTIRLPMINGRMNGRAAALAARHR